MQLKQVYMVRKFEKPYTKWITKSDFKRDLFSHNFGRTGGLLLFKTESEEEAETFFKKIKVKSKKLRNRAIFCFYYFDKFTSDKNDHTIAIEPISFKNDMIKE